MEMETYLWLLIAGAGVGAGFFLGWIIKLKIGQRKLNDAEILAKKIISEAEQEAENIKKSKLLEAKDEWYQLKQELDRETRQRKNELQRLEAQLVRRETNMERKADLLERREKELSSLEQNLKQKEQQTIELQRQLEQQIEEQTARLERISGITQEEAKRLLMESMEQQAREEAAQIVKDIRDQARLRANREAKEIIIQAIERTAVDHTAETTVSVVQLSNDEMKGRIIGREGRNIRAFEMATGVEVIVDDTPQAVLLSGFDPLRREIAKIALEKLIADGRIHPGRIEDVVEKAKKELQEQFLETGEQALMETGIHGVHPELVKLLGKLKYRTSYGQNVLRHSVEVSHLAGLMAAQLGLDSMLAKRAGLLHDIGKAVDRYTEGTHAQIGVELAKKYGEGPIVQNSIAAYEEDTKIISPIAVLVQAADSISCSRPGARREILEQYIRRLQKLEQLAQAFDGVQKTFAIQAGREIRVIVEPEKIDDAKAEQLALDIANRIQSEIEYPGQIKVTVIREYRAIDFAK